MLWHCAVCTLHWVVSENILCVTYDTVPYVQLLRHSAVSEWWAGAVCLCRGSYTGNFAFDMPETAGRKSDGSWRQLPHSWLTSKHYLLFIVIICSGNNNSDSSTATTHGWRRGILVSGVRQWTKLTHVGPGYNWDGCRLQAGIPSRAVISQLGQLSLASLRGRLIEYQLRLG